MKKTHLTFRYAIKIKSSCSSNNVQVYISMYVKVFHISKLHREKVTDVNVTVGFLITPCCEYFSFPFSCNSGTFAEAVFKRDHKYYFKQRE